MNHLGELISIGVAISWTFTAWFADKASRRVGAMVTNVLRLMLATLFLGVLLWFTVGHPYPVYADKDTWIWLGLSALVGYVLVAFQLVCPDRTLQFKEQTKLSFFYHSSNS